MCQNHLNPQNLSVDEGQHNPDIVADSFDLSFCSNCNSCFGTLYPVPLKEIDPVKDYVVHYPRCSFFYCRHEFLFDSYDEFLDNLSKGGCDD